MNLTNLLFARPWWFLALIPLVWFISRNFYHAMRQSQWDQVCDKKLIPYVIEQPAKGHNFWKSLNTLLAGLLLVIALAGPSWKDKKNPALVNQSAVVIALDLSSSMNATDVKPSRLQRAKFKIEDILKKRKEGLTALIVYAADAYTVTPLTADVKTILAQLPVLIPSIMPAQGSHPELAIDLAVDLLKQAEQAKGNILLVTDEVNATDDITAAKDAKGKGYRVSVLGIGTEQGAPIPQNRSFIRDSRGQLIMAKINPSQMKYLASSGGGLFYKMRSDNADIEGLSALFENSINSIKKAGDDLKIDARIQEGPWFALFALPFLLLLFRKKQMNIKLLGLLLLLPMIQPQKVDAAQWKDIFLNQDQIAKKQFDKGNHKEAAKTFEDPKWKQIADYKSANYTQALADSTSAVTSDDWYNKGNILARLGKTDEAIESYKQAIKLNGNNEDAIYNKKLLEKQKKKQQKNKNKKDKNKSKNKKQNKKDKNSKGKGSGKKSKDKKDQKNKQNRNKNDKEKQQKKKSSDKQKQKKDKQQKNKAQQQKEKQKKKQQKKKMKGEEKKLKPNEADEEKKQWLRRIPDDPSMLWKRKFYYQYKNSDRRPEKTGEKKW